MEKFTDPFPDHLGCNWAKIRAFYSMKRDNETVTQFAMRQLRNEVLEQAATTALEQRCVRGTSWDSACLAVAKRIREMKDE